MKTIIVGGGKGCRSLLGLTTGLFLKELKLDVKAVVDTNPNAPGMLYAANLGLRTYSRLEEALNDHNPEIIIELTGSEEALKNIFKIIKPGIRIIDHTFARIFWDIINVQEEQNNQLKELKTLEHELENEQHLLQGIFDNLTDLVLLLDKNYHVLKVNKNFTHITGLKTDSVIGKNCSEMLTLAQNELLQGPGENWENCELKSLFDLVISTGKTQIIIRRTPPPNENHWEISAVPVKFHEGKVDAILNIWHRITERVMLHREIESAEQRFKSFINSAQDWLSIKDLDGKYLIVNPVIARSFHIPVEDFIGKTPLEVLPPKKLAETIMIHDNEVIRTRQAHTYDEIIPIDGQDHHFQTVRFPLTDYQNEIVGVCTIARDISKEIRLQDQLVQNEKLAALGKLAAGVAHEINNPLTGILAYAEDLYEELPETDNNKEDISIIIRETLRCRDIVRNLLDFARQDTPKLKIVEPDKIIENTLLLVRRLPHFKDISINNSNNDNIPLINADPYQIQQVLLNLMINAADAMKYKGAITISLNYDQAKDLCMISVEDTGPGIPENLADKIFEPFFSTKGTSGLGLAVSWGIVERHKGEMEIDIAESGGAIFRILLPAFHEDGNM